MISKIHIKNFKSVWDLEFELGRVNVLIGENGSGKSNVLEGIAFGAAGAANKLDHEFLSSRGIRATEPEWMRSGFEGEQNYIMFVAKNADAGKKTINGLFVHNNQPYSNWENVADSFMFQAVLSKFAPEIKQEFGIEFDDLVPQLGEVFTPVQGSKELFFEWIHLGISLAQIEPNKRYNAFEFTEGKLGEYFINAIKKQNNAAVIDFKDFVIFSPENSALRQFKTEGQIRPLGINGEGLFEFLKKSAVLNPEIIEELNTYLQFIGWFETFEVPQTTFSSERTLQIKDRYISESLKYFDERSANEGFLFLLFYFSLFISKDTPKFFAIDNIDASLNPKLCRELMVLLNDLAVKHDKQVIFTTHNPAILDGLDLNDDNQRLFVVRRNRKGHTSLKRVERKADSQEANPIKLSEAFMNGFIGGLPKNF